MLSELVIKDENITPVINISPAEISVDDWKAVAALGPFGNDNPSPKFYTERGTGSINPLGKGGKHSYLLLNGSRLLAFNTAPVEIAELLGNGVKGWIYHPRLDYWKNVEQLQFILDCAVIEGGM